MRANVIKFLNLIGISWYVVVLLGCNQEAMTELASGSDNSVPLVQDDAVALAANHTLDRYPVLQNDIDLDGDQLHLVTANSVVGHASIESDAITFVPPRGFTGEVRIMYSVSDGVAEQGGILTVLVIAEELPVVDLQSEPEAIGAVGRSEPAPLLPSSSQNSSTSAPILRLNRPPVASDDFAQIAANRTGVRIGVMSNDVDPDGDNLEIVDAIASRGEIGFSGGSVVYTPPRNYSGEVVIQYVITDGRAQDTGVLELRVVANDQLPVATNDEGVIHSGAVSVFDVLENDFDPEGSALRLVSATTDRGRVTINSLGQLEYAAQSGFVGSAVVHYQVSDGSLVAGADLKLIVIAPPTPNTPPAPKNDVANIAGAGKLVNFDVLANDVDIDGDHLFLVSAKANNGYVSFSPGGLINWEPVKGWSGTAVVSYTISDGKSESEAVLVIKMQAAVSGQVAEEQLSSVHKVLLSWEAPTKREMGEQMLEVEIDSYELAFKRVDQAEFEKIQIDGASNSFELSGLSAGNYVFKLATLDVGGLKSSYSVEMHASVGPQR